MLIGIVAVAAALALVLGGVFRNLKLDPAGSGSPSVAPPVEHPAATEIEGTVLCDQKGIRVTATGFDFSSDWGFSVLVTLENTTENDYAVQVEKSAINHCMVDAYFSCDVAAGETVADEISFDYESIEAAGIEEIGEIDLSLDVFDWDTYEDLFISELVTLRTGQTGEVSRPAPEGDLLLDADGIRISYLGCEVDSYGDGIVYLFIENDTAREINVTSTVFGIDNLQTDGLLYANILPGYATLATVYIWDQELAADALDDVQFGMAFDVYDAENYEVVNQTDLLPFHS